MSRQRILWAIGLSVGVGFGIVIFTNDAWLDNPRDVLTGAPQENIVQADGPVASATRSNPEVLGVEGEDEFEPSAETTEYLDQSWGGFATLTYREVLTGLEGRFEAVENALQNPRCTIGFEKFDLAAAEKCNATDFVKLAHLIDLCRRIARVPPEENLARRRKLLDDSTVVNLESWYRRKAFGEREYQAQLVAAEECNRYQTQLNALPILEGYLDPRDDPSPFSRVKALSYLEQAARLGGPVSAKDYVDAYYGLVSGYIAGRLQRGGGMSDEAWNDILARQAHVERYLLTLATRDPVEYLLALARFEGRRVALDTDFDEGMSYAQSAEHYLLALTYYFAAESLSDVPLGRAEYPMYASNALDASVVELARSDGLFMAEKYRGR